MIRGRTGIGLALAVALSALAPSTASATPSQLTPPVSTTDRAPRATVTKPTAVLASSTSAEVTILVGGLRADITLQPTAQVLMGRFVADETVGTAFLYNPGPGKDGLLTYEVVSGKIEASFTEMPVGGTYHPFVVPFDDDEQTDIFWYGWGDAKDYLWTFGAEGTPTSVPRVMAGEYTPVVFHGPGNSEMIGGYQAILWYAAGTDDDPIWVVGMGTDYIERTVEVNGRYRPIVGNLLRPGLWDGQEILWYSQDGPDYIWSSTSTPWQFGSMRAPDMGPRRRPVVGKYRDELDGGNLDSIFWYAPGTTTEVIWASTSPQFEEQHIGSFPAGSITGDYRILTYGPNDVLLLTSGTTAKIGHITANGPTGYIGLTGLPPAPRAASGTVRVAA